MTILSRKNDLRKKERQFLPDVIPLKTPFVMYIEPTNVCNFECSFCPTGNKKLLQEVQRKDCFMPLDLFKKLVDDLKEFPDKIKLINLWKDGESFLHPQLAEMCEYLGKANVAERFIIRTNGTLLEKKLNEKIIASGINEIGISIEAMDDQKYFELTRRKVSYDSLIRKVRELHEISGDCRIYVKTLDVGLTEEEKQKFYNDFSSISDVCTIEYLMGWSGDHSDKFKLGYEVNVQEGGSPLNKISVCTLPFTTMAVNSNGDVSTCNADWMHKNIVGNIKEQSITDIWNGEILRNFRIMHLKHLKENNAACKNCDFITQGVDSIDGYEEKVLNQLNFNLKK